MFNPKSWNQTITLNLVAQDLNAVVTSAVYPAGLLPINGDKTKTYLALFPTARSVVVYCAGNDVGITFNISGIVNGVNATESVQGVNAGTVSTVALFSSVVSVIPTGNTVGNVSVGDATTNNLVCNSQAGTANTPLIINGTRLSGQYNTINPQFLIINCAGNESANSFTISGSDQSGAPYTYTVPGVNIGTVIIPIPYQQIGNGGNGNFEGSILMNNAAAAAVSVGITPQTATPWIQCDQTRPYFLEGVNVILSAGAVMTYTVETTLQNAIRQYIANPFPDQTLNNSTNPLGTTLLNGPTAFFRLRINSWTSGSATLVSAQIGSAFASTPTDRNPK